MCVLRCKRLPRWLGLGQAGAAWVSAAIGLRWWSGFGQPSVARAVPGCYGQVLSLGCCFNYFYRRQGVLRRHASCPSIAHVQASVGCGTAANCHLHAITAPCASGVRAGVTAPGVQWQAVEPQQGAGFRNGSGYANRSRKRGRVAALAYVCAPAVATRAQPCGLCCSHGTRPGRVQHQQVATSHTHTYVQPCACYSVSSVRGKHAPCLLGPACEPCTAQEEVQSQVCIGGLLPPAGAQSHDVAQHCRVSPGLMSEPPATRVVVLAPCPWRVQESGVVPGRVWCEHVPQWSVTGCCKYMRSAAAS